MCPQGRQVDLCHDREVADEVGFGANSGPEGQVPFPLIAPMSAWGRKGGHNPTREHDAMAGMQIQV